jgi:sensor histidine kinase YesM
MENLVNLCKILGLVALCLFFIVVIISILETAISNIIKRSQQKKFIKNEFPKMVEEIQKLAKEAEKEIEDNKKTNKKPKTTKKTTKKDSK